MNSIFHMLKRKPVDETTLLHYLDGWFHRLFISEAVLSFLLVLCFIGIAYTGVVAGCTSYE